MSLDIFETSLWGRGEELKEKDKVLGKKYTHNSVWKMFQLSNTQDHSAGHIKSIDAILKIISATVYMF